ncbi:MAG: DUF6356 family protein [Micropepsaceae bacterium]
MFDRLFLAHPRSVGETYVEHATMATSFAARLFVAACACFMHALVPALFPRTASRIIAALHGRMIANRRLSTTGAGAFDYAI